MFMTMKDAKIQYDEKYAAGKLDAESGKPYPLDCNNAYSHGYLDVVMKQNNLEDRLDAMYYIMDVSKNYQ